MDARTAAGPGLVERLTRMESELRDALSRWRRLVITGTMIDYDVATHTATVTVAGVDYPGIPVSYAILPNLARAGANVGGTAGIMGFNSQTPSVGCVVYITSTTPPPDPFDRVDGHRHRGIEGDAPTL
jgi:hypothetical protein